MFSKFAAIASFPRLDFEAFFSKARGAHRLGVSMAARGEGIVRAEGLCHVTSERRAATLERSIFGDGGKGPTHLTVFPW
jgi:hypothetical protein